MFVQFWLVTFAKLCRQALIGISMSLNLENEFYHENFEIRKYRPSKFSSYTVINIPYLKLHNQCKIC